MPTRSFGGLFLEVPLRAWFTCSATAEYSNKRVYPKPLSWFVLTQLWIWVYSRIIEISRVHNMYFWSGSEAWLCLIGKYHDTISVASMNYTGGNNKQSPIYLGLVSHRYFFLHTFAAGRAMKNTWCFCTSRRIQTVTGILGVHMTSSVAEQHRALGILGAGTSRPNAQFDTMRQSTLNTNVARLLCQPSVPARTLCIRRK